MKLLFDQNLSFKLSLLPDHAPAIATFEQEPTATCLEIL